MQSDHTYLFQAKVLKPYKLACAPENEILEFNLSNKQIWIINNEKYGIITSEWHTFLGIFSACVTEDENSKGHYTKLEKTVMLSFVWRCITRRVLVSQGIAMDKLSGLSKPGHILIS